MELTVEQMLQQGVAAHNAGNLKEAERLYRAILQIQPKHLKANYNLGLIAVSIGQSGLALSLFENVIDINPNIEQFWLSYIDTLIAERQFENAKSALKKGKNRGVAKEKLKALTQKLVSVKAGSNVMRAPSQGEIQKLLNHYQNGQYGDAEKLAISITEQFPEHQFTWKVLGVVLKQAGRISESLVAGQKAVDLDPQDAAAHSNLGNTLRELKKLDEAEASCRQAIALKSDFAEAHSNLGNTLQELGRLDGAEASYRQAIALKSGYATAHYNLGSTLQLLGKSGEALASYRQAIALAPNYAQAHNNLGTTLQELGRSEEAEESYRQAIALKLDYAEAHYNLGNTLMGLGKLEEAEASYKQTIALKSDYAEAYSNMGNTLNKLERLEGAEASYRQAIALKSDDAPSHYNLGNTLLKLEKLDEAEASYRQAITLKSDLAEAHNSLGRLLHARGLGTKSLDCFLTAMTLNPDSVSFRWDFSINQLSKVYLTYDDIKNSLHRFEVELTKLQKFITAQRLDEAVEAVGKSQPYYLAYFEIDNKYLLEKYGEICCRVMKHWQEKNLIATVNSVTKRGVGERIKVGIVSAHIRYHSVWNAFLKGVVKNLDSEKFEVHIFSFNNEVDNETELAKTTAKFFTAGERGLAQWANKIRNSEIDIAFYPEIGMHPQTLKLASMRLAPVQVCSWGHPETSGLPTMDYYISSELLETPGSDKFYTEKLIKLPSLGLYYEPLSLESSDVDFIQMGINPNTPKLLCLGVPNKFSPLHDWVFIEIIKRLGDCQLIFMNDEKGASEILERRLRTRAEDAEIIFDRHVVFVPNQSRQGFSALMKSADVLLDTLGFSGFNTAMHAIGCGLPVITREGKFMRTRHASAILRKLGIEELITKTETEYIDLVEKLVLDRKFLHNIQCKIKDKENYLYRNENAIRALEDFFESVISGSLKSELRN